MRKRCLKNILKSTYSKNENIIVENNIKKKNNVKYYNKIKNNKKIKIITIMRKKQTKKNKIIKK